jgi:hypothetical protein
VYVHALMSWVIYCRGTARGFTVLARIIRAGAEAYFIAR